MTQTQTDRIVTNPDEGFVAFVPLAFQEDQIETREMGGIVGGNWKKKLAKEVVEIIKTWTANKALDKALDSITGDDESENFTPPRRPVSGIVRPR